MAADFKIWCGHAVKRKGLLVFALTVGIITAPAVAAAGRIETGSRPLPLLARSLADAPVAVRWEFANLALDTMLGVYREELSASSLDAVRSDRRRRKLARWQRATSDLIARLEMVRARLVAGGQFDLLVDPQDQVLVIAGDTPVAISGLDDASDRAIESRLITNFCGFNDCSILDRESTGGETPPRLQGTWRLYQHSRPAYVIDGVLGCEFPDLANREASATACQRVAADALAVAEALVRGARQGHLIDWHLLAANPPAQRPHSVLRINAAGDYLEMHLPAVSALSRRDWSVLVDWLGRRSRGEASEVTLRDIDRGRRGEIPN